jgi:hypothetical protein
MADAPGLESGDESRGGSSPSTGTKESEEYPGPRVAISSSWGRRQSPHMGEYSNGKENGLKIRRALCPLGGSTPPLPTNATMVFNGSITGFQPEGRGSNPRGRSICDIMMFPLGCNDSGLITLPWKQGFAGSNPAIPTISTSGHEARCLRGLISLSRRVRFPRPLPNKG